jgi:hypothetical protein
MARMASGAATADPTTIITQRRDCRQPLIFNSFSENVAGIPMLVHFYGHNLKSARGKNILSFDSHRLT